MKSLIMITCLFLYIGNSLAQDCQPKDDMAALPGKYIDAAHCEWPQEKMHWLDQLKTPASKAFAGKKLTQIELLEKESRKSYILNGGVLKTAFGTPSNANIYFGKNLLLAYDLNLGCYEYCCYNNKVKTSDEYAITFRANINKPFYGVEAAFQFADDNPYYETYQKYNGKFIDLCTFLKLDTNKMHVNSGKGYYQDIPESSVKPGDRNSFLTRHWYYTKNGVLPFIPVTRKEYLEALLVYYEREALDITDKIKEIEKQAAGMMKDPAKYPQLYENGKKFLASGKAKYPDWQKRIETKKALVQKALKDNDATWLAKPAVVKSKKENFSWKSFYGPGSSDYVTVDGYYTDTPDDAKNTGAFTFSGFWDDKAGMKLYKYNPEYFKGTEKNPAQPYLIELTYRYLNIPLGRSLVENFTANFDHEAIKQLLE